MKLPEKLYYTLEEAAEMANCKVSDLLHFAANGKLEICARLDSNDLYNHVIVVRPPDWIFKKRVNAPKEDQKKGRVFEFYLKPKEHLGFIRFIRQSRSMLFADAFNTLFALNEAIFQKIEFGDDVEKLEIGATYVTLPRNSHYKVTAVGEGEELEVTETLDFQQSDNIPAFVVHIEDQLSLSSLVVTSQELKLFMAGGEDRATLSPKEQEAKIHGNAVNNAIKREEVFAAALYCLKHFYDECADSAKLARKIEENAALFWPKDAAPPLATSTMEERLREILKLRS